MFDEKKLKDEVALITQIITESEAEIFKAMNGKNLWRDSERVNMLAKTKSILSALKDDLIAKANPLIEKYYEMGNKEVKDGLEVDPTKAFQSINTAPLEFLVASLPEIQSNYGAEVRNILSNSYTNIENSLNLVKKQIRTEMINDLGKAEITGKSRDKLSRELVQKLKDKGLTGFKIPTQKIVDGVVINGEYDLSLETYARGLTQSTMITSRGSAVIQRAIERGHDLLQISSHSNPSKMCAKWAGKIVSISGKDKRYPSLREATFKGKYEEGGGIFHRWCTHNLYVYIESSVVYKDNSTESKTRWQQLENPRLSFARIANGLPNKGNEAAGTPTFRVDGKKTFGTLEEAKNYMETKK